MLQVLYFISTYFFNCYVGILILADMQYKSDTGDKKLTPYYVKRGVNKYVVRVEL